MKQIYALIFFIFMLLLSFIYAPISYANKIDLDGQNIIIEKLENTLRDLAPQDKTIDRNGLKLQLANLYSEKARNLVVLEGQESCQNCKNSLGFRQKALQIYKEIIPQLAGIQKDEVSLQLAFLYELQHQDNESKKIYTQIIENKKADENLRIRSYEKRGNIFFQEAQFTQALNDYQSALTHTPENQRGTLLHKIAWTYFNQGEIDTALTKLNTILSHPPFLQQPSAEGWVYSLEFHNEVAHDLMRFLAKTQLTSLKINQIKPLLPHSEMTAHYLFLGDESERMGQTQSAIYAWEQALSLPDFPNEKKPVVYLKMARIQRELFHFNEALKYLTLALNEANSVHCVEKCTDFYPHIKQFFVQWEKLGNKSTALKNQSPAFLLKAYSIYNAQSKDIDTHIWEAQLLRAQGDTNSAKQKYAQTADLMVTLKDFKPDLLNKVLMSEIELAITQVQKVNVAKTKTSSQKGGTLNPAEQDLIQAYQHYLKLLPLGENAAQVQFQFIEIYFNSKNYNLALQEIEHCDLNRLSTTHKKIVLTQKLFIFEMNLDFKAAYQTALELKWNESHKAVELFKLAVLAQLAATDAKPWFYKVTELPEASVHEKNLARAELIRLSEQPWKSLRDYKTFLKTDMPLLAEMTLVVFERDSQFDELNKYLAMRGFKSTPAGAELEQIVFLKTLENLHKQIINTKLNSQSDQTLAESIKLRLKQLAQLKVYLQQAQKQQNWVTLVLATSTLQINESRLAYDIMHLPEPKGLTLNEKLYFKKGLEHQALPFMKEEFQLGHYLKQLWGNSVELKAYIRDLENYGLDHKLKINIAKNLLAFTPKEKQNLIESAINQVTKPIAESELQDKEKLLKENPFDQNRLHQLIDVEKKAGHFNYVGYLQSRKYQITNGRGIQ